MAILNKQPVRKTGKARKETLVANLTKRFDGASGIVFTDYQGLTHQQLETLKNELKEKEAKLLIAKNSLVKLALGNSKNFKEAKDNEALEGPTATLFIQGDMIDPLKSLQKAIKEFGKPVVRFGILEGTVMDETGVLKIASLPGRETLLTQLVAMLYAPIQGFASGLNSIPQKLVMTLDAISKNKTSEPSPPLTSDQTLPAEVNQSDKNQTEPKASSQSPDADSSEATPDSNESKDEEQTEQPKENEDEKGGEK